MAGPHYKDDMALSLIVVPCGVMVVSYLLANLYRRQRDRIQPSYMGLLFMVITVGCFLSAFYVLRRFGIDLPHRPPLNMFWLALSMMWLVLATWMICQRKMGGTVLLDLGPPSKFGLWIGLAVFGAALAIGLAITGPRAQAFAFGAQSICLFVMARSRSEVRERGVISSPGGLLRWNRIAGCVATDNIVRLRLKKGLQRTLDIRLPADRRDEFIQLVNARRR